MNVSTTGRLSKRSEDRPPDGEFGAIAQLGERLHGMQEVDGFCSAFDVARSCYYVHRLRRRRVDARRVALRSQVNQLFSQSRGSAGSRSILGMLREEGVTIGNSRFSRFGISGRSTVACLQACESGCLLTKPSSRIDRRTRKRPMVTPSSRSMPRMLRLPADPCYRRERAVS